MARVGGGTSDATPPQAADDRTVEERQVQVQREAENWLLRTFFILKASINGGLILLGYLFGGVEGIRVAMFIVAAGIVLAFFLIGIVFNGFQMSVEDFVFGLLSAALWSRLALLLAVLNGAGEFLLAKLQ